jgi:predicted ATPase
MMLAGAYAKVGRPGDGLNCLAEAAEIIETTDERLGEAQLHRLRGDLLDATGDLPAAELSYRQGVEVARRQNAKLFELRAAIGLARLMGKQGRPADGRDLLAPIYNWFTEGFNAPDLKEAKVLLDSLR